MQKAYTTPNPTPNFNTIAEIEKALSKYNRPKTKADKSEKQRLKTELAKIYNNNKKFLTEFEKTNYKYLALLKSTRGFYKLIGHSALFYAHNIAPKLNLAANLQPDGDFAYKSPSGVISVRNLAKTAEALATINIKQLRTRNRTGDLLLFALPWTFTEEQIAEMMDKQNFKFQNFNHIVLVDNMIPVLFLQLEELLKAIYENVRGMGGPVERETFGYDLIRAVTTMNHTYLDLTSGRINRETCLTHLKSDLNFVKYQVKLIADLKIWTPKTSSRIAEIIIKISDIITRELKANTKGTK